MPLPRPDQLCDVCKTLMKDFLARDIPWEDEPAISHQPNLIVLEESSQSCALCYQVWVAAGRSLANRGGMVTFMPKKKIGDRDITIQAAASNFALGGMFRAMANGAMVSNTADDIRPDLSELQWVHPRSVAQDPEKVGSYLFGNWYQSPYQGDESLKLIGLGVRLGTSPLIGDALGNKPDEWFLAGTYLRFRTTHDSVNSNFMPGKIRCWDLSSARALGQVRAWLNICDKHHQCLKHFSAEGSLPVLPTRVLCLEENNEKVYLLESQEKRAQYIALSHSWGNSHRLTLMKSNIATLQSGIKLAEIPQTFRDAIIICRALGVQYLWIDSLCIIQDDPTDWGAESSKMSSVYMNAYLTVSALHSADDADGCFPSMARTSKQMPFPFVSPDVVCTGRPTIANAVPLIIPKESTGSSDDSYNHAVVFSIHGTDDKKFYVTNEWMPPSTELNKKRYGTFNFGASFDPLKPEPLSSRGWVLQERLLSPRTLHYSEGQMYWECQNIVLGEDGSMLKRMFPQVQTIVESRQKAMQLISSPFGQHPSYVADEWLKLVEVFCTRKLTMEHDKLVAISGLARIVGESSGDEYCAGLWKSNILNGLCWKKRAYVPRHHCSDEAHEHALPEATLANITLPAEYRAPTWSWASVDGQIEFENTWLSTTAPEAQEKVAQEVNVAVTPLGDFPYGRVKTGFITFKTVIGDLRPADTPPSKQEGQVLDQFHVEALCVQFPRGRASHKRKEEKLAKEKPASGKKGSIGKLFSGLRISSASSSSSSSSSTGFAVKCKVLFDRDPKFPCTAAFITNKFALVLACREMNSYTRIGTAEFSGKDAEEFMKDATRDEIFIL